MYYKANFEETEKALSKGNVPSYCQHPIWALKEGENLIRILPPWNERGVVFKMLSLHWFGSGDNKIATICRRQFGEKCYICEVVQKLISLEILSNDKANLYVAKKRAFCNGIDLKDLEKGVQIMSLPVTKVVNELILYAKDPEYGDFTHPEKGYNIKVIRVTEGLYPSYKVIPKREITPIPSSVKWETQMFNLDDFENVWIYHSYEKQKSLWEIYSDLVVSHSTDEVDLLPSTGQIKEDVPLNSVSKLKIDDFKLD
jgi:hypothetical protein